MTTFTKPVHSGSAARYEITTKKLADKTDEAADDFPELELEDALGASKFGPTASALEGGSTSDYFLEVNMLESWGVGEFRGIWTWVKGGGNFRRTFTFIVDEAENI